MAHKLPSPWTLIVTRAVGGLTEVGFSRNERFLLVTSHNGSGVIDVHTGERVARSSDTLAGPLAGTLLGIGPIDGEAVAVAGLWGGELEIRTKDGWSAQVLANGVVLRSPDGRTASLFDDVSEVRAAGYSANGQTFVLATSADISIFSRSAATPS